MAGGVPRQLGSAVVLVLLPALMGAITAHGQDVMQMKKQPLSTKSKPPAEMHDNLQGAGSDCLCAAFSSPICAGGVTYSNTCWAICAGVPAGSWSIGACGMKPGISDTFIAAGPCGHLSDCSHVSDVVNVYSDGQLVCGWCQLGESNDQGYGLQCDTGTGTGIDCLPTVECPGLWITNLETCGSYGSAEYPAATGLPSESSLKDTNSPTPTPTSTAADYQTQTGAPALLPNCTDMLSVPSPVPEDPPDLVQPSWTVFDSLQNQSSQAVAGICSHCSGNEDSRVCGADGITYTSRCQAECKGVAVAEQTACSVELIHPNTSLASHWKLACLTYCSLWPESPSICGADNLPYPNACVAACSDVEVSSLEGCK